MGEYLKENSHLVRISPIHIHISYILSLLDSNRIDFDHVQKREKLSLRESNSNKAESAYRRLKKTIDTIMCVTGFAIIRYLNDFGTFTKPGLVHYLSLSWGSVNRVVNKFVTLGIVEQYGHVGIGLRRNMGRSVPIYGLPDIDPQLVIEAQKRYGAIRGSTVSVDIVPELIDEIVNAFGKRSKPLNPIDQKTIALFVKQPSMKIPPFLRNQYIEQVTSKLSKKGIEVYGS